MADVPNHKPPTKLNKSFREFGGLNTQANRTMIEDDEFSWIENVMPIGFGNMPALYGPTDTGVSLSGTTCYYMQDANISNVDYMFMFSTDGSARQINLTTYAVTVVGIAGTFNGTSTRITQWKNDRILIIDSGGYYGWDGATRTSLGGTTSAPSAGTTIAVFSGHVWIGNGRTVVFSVADSYTDFSTGASGGGSFIITDSTLHSTIKQMLSANGFLYIIGHDSVNVVSDVRFSTTTSTTIFSNLNLVTTAGTDSPDSVISYYRTIWLYNQWGFFGITGATATKGSDKLDGIIPLIQTSQSVTGGVVLLNNILCLAFLFSYADPVLGTRSLLAVHFNKKWFLASQGSATYTFAATGTSSGVPALFATTGGSLYKLFSNTSYAISQTIKTRLWDFGDPILYKQAMKLGLEVITSSTVVNVTATIDTEVMVGLQTPIVTASAIVTWQNNSSTIVSWTNNASATTLWGTAGYSFQKADVSNVGKYLGATLNSNTPGLNYAGIHLQYENRGAW